jgi:hypothetical protein
MLPDRAGLRVSMLLRVYVYREERRGRIFGLAKY